jgi:DNA repair photolyase
LLRLPLELKDLFSEWLQANFPDKLKHVMSLVRTTRGGKTYDSSWGERMTGSGPYAWMIGRRFEVAAERLGFTKDRLRLRTDLFVPPVRPGGQLSLFSLDPGALGAAPQSREAERSAA